MNVYTIFNYTIITVGFLWIIYQLWIFTHAGKLIIKANMGKSKTDMWVVFFIIWFLTDWFDKKLTSNIFYALNILGILLTVVVIIRSRMDKEIRENGIYCNSHFYRWSQIKSYKWISSKIIKFNTNTGAFLTSDGSFELVFKEDTKSKIDEALQNYIHS